MCWCILAFGSVDRFCMHFDFALQHYLSLRRLSVSRFGVWRACIMQRYTPTVNGEPSGWPEVSLHCSLPNIFLVAIVRAAIKYMCMHTAPTKKKTNLCVYYACTYALKNRLLIETAIKRWRWPTGHAHTACGIELSPFAPDIIIIESKHWFYNKHFHSLSLQFIAIFGMRNCAHCALYINNIISIAIVALLLHQFSFAHSFHSFARFNRRSIGGGVKKCNIYIYFYTTCKRRSDSEEKHAK